MVEHTSHNSVDGDEDEDKFAVRWACTGLTHVVFFSPKSSWDEVKDGLKAAKKEMGPLEKRGTDDGHPSYGLYYIPVDKPSTPVPSSLKDRVMKFIRRTFGSDQYREQVHDGYKKIVDEFKIDEKERLRDAICVLGIGEGTKPAIEVARIVSKVGVLQDWTFDVFRRALEPSKGNENSKRLRCFVSAPARLRSRLLVSGSEGPAVTACSSLTALSVR